MKNKKYFIFLSISLAFILFFSLVYSQEQEYFDNSLNEQEVSIIDNIPIGQSTGLDSLIGKFGKNSFSKEFGWEDIDTDRAEYIIFSHNQDSMNLEFNSPSSSFSYYDKEGIKRSFSNIMPSTSKVPSYLEFDTEGNLKEANFQVGDETTEYSIGNTKLSAPANSIVNYDSETKEIEISLEKGTKIDGNLATFMGDNIEGIDFSKSDYLTLGEKGDSIKGLRNFFGLETSGESGNVVDKEFTDAVSKYQKENNLPVDGKLGSTTYSSIREKIESKREKVIVNGENIELPGGKKLEKGNLKYSSEGYFVPKGESSTVSGFDIKSDDGDVALFEDKTKSYNYLEINEDGSYTAFGDNDGFEFTHKSKMSLPKIEFKDENDWLKIGDDRLSETDVKQLRSFFNLPTEDEGANMLDEDFRSAVQSYQSKNGIAGDGKLGKATYEHMQNYLSGDNTYSGRVDSLPEIKFDSAKDILREGDISSDEVGKLRSFFGLESGEGKNVIDKDFTDTIKKYQKENNLDVDGKIGQNTYQSMKEKLIPRDEILVNVKKAKVDFNSENNGFATQVYEGGEAKIKVGSENLVLKDRKLFISPSSGVGAHPFKVLDNYGNTFTQLKHNLAVGGFGTNIERAEKAYDAFLKKYGYKSHNSACGRGARDYYEVLGMDSSQIQNAFGGTTGWYAWQIKDKIKNAGGQTDVSLAQVQPLDVLHIGKISKRNFGHYSGLGGSPSVGDYRHVGVVAGYKDGEPLIFNAGFKSGPKLSKLSELEKYYGKDSYSFSRPNWNNANVNPNNFGFDYSSNIVLST